MPPALSPAGLCFWRHPKPQGHEGRCIGSRSDLRVDPRKAKRLAHRIRAHARRHGLPSAVVTSPARRCTAVGAWLRRWGWRHLLDAELAELDFGRWDGQPWAQIPLADIDAWVADFVGYAPGGGEPLSQLLARAAAWRPPPGLACAVGHGGFLRARRWCAERGAQAPSAADWTGVPAYGEALPDPLR